MSTRPVNLEAEPGQSGATRPLRIVARRDLVVKEHLYQGETWYAIKNPLALAYFRLSDLEYRVFRLLDGRRSLTDLKRAIEVEDPTRRMTLHELQWFVANLRRSGLVIADRPGQAAAIETVRAENRRASLMQVFGNLLCLRWRGFDPDRLLTAIYPYFRWCFSRWAVIAAMLMGLWALIHTLLHFETFHAKLPAFHEFFTPSSALGLMLALALVKVLHEFGHGLLCKHYGGEVREMGVMLLVFTPCLYCDASDSMLFPSKWRRAAVAAAGMYVELILASLATFVWWNTEQGMANHLALHVILVCSAGTLFFNGNPLMRYDGYYILSDLVEVPLLREKSGEIVRTDVTRWFEGHRARPRHRRVRGHDGWYIAYFVASELYRVVITISILWFFLKVLEPYRLEVFGKLLALSVVAGLILTPLNRLRKFLSSPGSTERVRGNRVVLAGALGLTLLAGFLFIPWPRHITAPSRVIPYAAHAVYAPREGQLVELHAQLGQVVEQGAPLATLRNLDLESTAEDLRRKRDRVAVRLETMRMMRFREPAAAGQSGELEKSLAGLNSQLERREEELASLVLRAPRAGKIVPPPAVPRADPEEEHKLGDWSGSPWEPRNAGCHLVEKTLLCQIAQPAVHEVELIVDQTDAELIEPGQAVRLMSDHAAVETLVGTVREVARVRMDHVPAELSGKTGGEVATRSSASGAEKPQSPSYVVRVELRGSSAKLLPGFRGMARVQVSSATLFGRMLRQGRLLWRTEI